MFSYLITNTLFILYKYKLYTRVSNRDYIVEHAGVVEIACFTIAVAARAAT